MTTYTEWTELPHGIWGEGGPEYGVHEIVKTMTFPKTIWRKGIFSIVPPCSVTMDMWELFPVDGDVERFPTLQAAQEFADKLSQV